MNLGAFSVSLNVKDIKQSKKFYESLGFEVFAGDIQQNYLIMKNQQTILGLFQGMLESNILTFNPRWNQNCETQTDFPDIRKINKVVTENKIEVQSSSLKNPSGPGSFMIADPDGNIILFDQHV